MSTSSSPTQRANDLCGAITFEQGSVYSCVAVRGLSLFLVAVAIKSHVMDTTRTYSPPPVVNDIWQDLLLRPRLYQALCERYLEGVVVDHNPDRTMDSDEDKQSRRRATLRLVRETFPNIHPSTAMLFSDGLDDEEEFVLHIQPLTGDRFRLLCNKGKATTIMELRELIQSQQGIFPEEEMQLMYRQIPLGSSRMPYAAASAEGQEENKRLDEKSLADYGIVSHSILYFISQTQKEDEEEVDDKPAMKRRRIESEQ